MAIRQINFTDVIGPSFYKAWNDFYRGWYVDPIDGKKKDLREQVFSGGRGCVDGDTVIDTPNGGIKIRDFSGGEILSYDGEKIVSAIACRPIRYTIEQLYRVNLSSGKSIVCTDEHRFLTSTGWKMEKELRVGDSLISSVYQPKTCRGCHSHHNPNEPLCQCVASRDIHSTETQQKHQKPISFSCSQKASFGSRQIHDVECQKLSHEDVPHLMRRLLGLLYRYWQDFRLCDGQLPKEAETYRDVLQQLAYVREHNHFLNRDEKTPFSGDSQIDLHKHRHSTKDCLYHSEDKCCVGEGSQIVQMLSESLSEIFPSFQLSQKTENLDGSIQQVAEFLLQSTSCDNHGETVFYSKDVRESDSLQMLSDMLQHTVHDESLSSSFFGVVDKDCVYCDKYIKCDEIVSIEYEKTDYYYDLFVPFYNNYLSNGIISHNSLKSSAVSVFLIMGLERDAREAAQHMKDGDPRWRSYLTHGIIFRKFASDLATSVYGQMQWAISKLGLDDEYVCQKSPLKIVRRRTGQTILFRGLDDPTKVKSLKPPSGYGFFKYLWAEEWDQFDGMEEIRSVRQSVLRGGHKFQTFYSFNPPETSANWANFEVSKPVEGRLVYRSDYRSVPAEWLGENFFIEADLLRQNNERAYRHEYLGEVTGNGGSVFPNIVKRTITDAELRTYDRLYLGLDFGFALDPSAFSAMYYDKNHHRLILFDEIYKTNLRNIELSELIKEKPYVGFNYIMCDSAEPKSIADLESYGINALPVQKTERRFGFKWLQSLNEIVIDPVRTPNAFREFSLAEYGKSKSGEFISKYPEINDHYLDSCIVGNTMVNTPLGVFPIENLVGKNGKLFGYDSHGNVKETAFVNCRKTRCNSETIIIEVEDSNTHINCTRDHKILTPDGYVQAGDLTIGSQVVTWSGIKRVSSKHDGKPQDVYDLEVPETHNFIVNEGLIIHNCRYATSEIAAQAGFC